MADIVDFSRIQETSDGDMEFEGELVRVTKSLFFAQARLYDPEHNRLCATATGTYKRQERQSTLPVS